MTPNASTLSIAISSRALFDLEASNQVYENEGIDAYADYQIKHENDPLEPGVAFHFVQKLLALNARSDTTRLTEVILVSRNSADTGLRIFHSIDHHKLDIVRATFTNGNPPYPYLRAFGTDLFLSTHPDDVRRALDSHCAAALLLPQAHNPSHPEQLRLAFDGDSVLFADESERIYQTQGLAAFASAEKAKANEPMNPGPFKNFLEALHQLQQTFPAGDQAAIRTALVTARSAPAHERVIKTLRAWNIRIDEAHFLGGLSKGAFLQAFGADIFFDDHQGHCQSATSHAIATGLVPHGPRHDQ